MRHCDGAIGPGLQFLFIQLTIAVGPYAVGEMIAINIME